MTSVRAVYSVTRDMKRSIEFYSALLAREPDFRDEDRWAEFKFNGFRFALSSPDEAARPTATTVAVFEVPNLERAAETILAQGGALLEKRDMGPHGRTLGFVDTDGVVAQLFERARPPA